MRRTVSCLVLSASVGLLAAQQPTTPQSKTGSFVTVSPLKPIDSGVRQTAFTMPAAKTPAPPTLQMPPMPQLLPAELTQPAVVPFDPAGVEVRGESGQWFWTDGRSVLRQFGRDRQSAEAALMMARELRANQYGRIGGAEAPVAEYWLRDGQAASGVVSRREVVPFKLDKLKAISHQGVWLLNDGRQTLLNFGPNEDEARQAVDVCRQYGFNEVAYIGRPFAATVLLRDPNRADDPNAENRLGPKPQPQSREALFVPKLGWVGEVSHFDPRRAELVPRDRAIAVRVGNLDIGTFGSNEHDARAVARLLQDLRVTAVCRLPSSRFSIYFAGGRLPRTAPLGTRTLAVGTDLLGVTQENGSWILSDGRQMLHDFGPSVAEARQALAVLQHFGCDSACEIGRGPATLRVYLRSK